jgi:hypothetical protein
MFDLRLLSCYKYFFKVDYDVFFLRPLSVDIFRQMEVKGAVFLHSGTAVQKSCGADMDTAMLDFTKDNKLQFKTKTVSDPNQPSHIQQNQLKNNSFSVTATINDVLLQIMIDL